jgi:hypothetical protein
LGWYDAYVAGRQNTTAFGLLLPAAWIEWTTLLFAGLTIVGIAALGDERAGPSRTLPLMMGASAWAYNLTDSGGSEWAYLAHAFFGVLFGLCWMALGCMLFWQGR